MRESKIGGFSERLKGPQAEARKALLEKFGPKPTVVQPEVFETRAQRKARELEEVSAPSGSPTREAARLAKKAEEAAAEEGAPGAGQQRRAGCSSWK